MAPTISKTEFKKRRDVLLSQCKPNSIVVIPAASEVTRSRDTEYLFRQDSYFWYLTGFNEPDAVLILSNSTERDKTVGMFVLPKDKHAEVWHGRRYGEDKATVEFDLDFAYNTDQLAETLPSILDKHDNLYYSFGHRFGMDDAVQEALTKCKNSPKNAMKAPSSISDVNALIDEMRLIKSDSEVDIMQHAATISAEAHKRAMRFAEPGKYEYQLEAEILHEFATNGARAPAYGSIVGSGNNACILHYTVNSDEIKQDELVLIDAGCEFLGYAADITRTFPVTGKFTPTQKKLYQIVLDAQLASIDVLKPGATFVEAMNASVEKICEGLIELGILKGSLEDVIKNEDWREYFMHGIGHYLGLDVHDVGIYKEEGKDLPLQEGTIITIEPGIYIAEDANVDEQYKGIGIRIEDNILITSTGYKNLTEAAPKTIEQIESLMAR